MSPVCGTYCLYQPPWFRSFRGKRTGSCRQDRDKLLQSLTIPDHGASAEPGGQDGADMGLCSATVGGLGVCIRDRDMDGVRIV